MVRLDAHELGRSKLVRLVVSRISSSIKTGSRRIIQLDDVSYVVLLERRITEHSSSKPVIRPGTNLSNQR